MARCWRSYLNGGGRKVWGRHGNVLEGCVQKAGLFEDGNVTEVWIVKLESESWTSLNYRVLCGNIKMHQTDISESSQSCFLCYPVTQTYSEATRSWDQSLFTMIWPNNSRNAVGPRHFGVWPSFGWPYTRIPDSLDGNGAKDRSRSHFQRS